MYLIKSFPRFVIVFYLPIILISSLYGTNPKKIQHTGLTNERAKSLIKAHPLSGQTDFISYCPNDGSEFHEIYLCGAKDKRELNVAASNFKQIVWSKYQEGSCSDECSKRSGSCIWSEVSTNTQYIVEDEGEYRISITYNDNSIERFYFNAFKNGLNPNATIVNIDCNANGSILVNNIPNSYEYSLTDGVTWQDSNLFTIDTAGTYDVLIRRKENAEGCVFSLDSLIVANNSIEAETSIIPITCDTNKGSVKVDISNPSSSYIFKLLQDGNLISTSGPVNISSYTFNNLSAGDYDIEVNLSDVSSCNFLARETIPSFQEINTSIVVRKNINCTPAIISVTENGGIGPYQHSIDGGNTFFPFDTANQTEIFVSTPGDYTIIIKDAQGCEFESNLLTISEENEITYNIEKKDITCSGNSDGSIQIDVTNSEGYSITYSIDGGSSFKSSDYFGSLSEGIYPIVIKKERAGQSCTLRHGDITILKPKDFSVTANVAQPITCDSGSATLEINVSSGGEAPFSYSLTGIDFNSSNTFTGLGPGNYQITAKDKNECLAFTTISIEPGNNPSDIEFTRTNVDCASGTTDIELNVKNGNAPFNYAITAPSNIGTPDNIFRDLSSGTYTFEVTANDGCKIIRNYTVPSPNQISIFGQVINNQSCFDVSSDGKIRFNVSNFPSTYSYTLLNGIGTVISSENAINDENKEFTGLPADSYTMTVTDDSSGCSKSSTLEIKMPTDALAIDSFEVTNINCGSPGSVEIIASGGWGNYRYAVKQPDNSITPFQSTNTISGLTQLGSHTILVRDINGCILDNTSFDLEDNGGPESIVDTSISNYCYSATNLGSLKINIIEGTSPYFYTVNNGTPVPISGDTFTLIDLTPDDYQIKVIGSNGCETLVADTRIAGQLFALATIVKPLGCGTTPEAEILVTPEEGYPPYSYEVSMNGGSYTATNMPYSTNTEGTFTFKVRDSKGCETITESVRTIQAPPLSSSAVITSTACGKDGTGAVELKASGGTAPYQFSFDGSPFTNQTLYPDLDATTYTYAIRDAMGCEIVESLLINGEDAITAEVTHTDITCDFSGGTVWGNTNINNVQNAQGLITIELVRVRDEADYLATGWSRVYRTRTNVNMSTQPGGWNEIMWWPQWFFVRITDERGCTFESDFYEIDQPPMPWFQKNQSDLDQTCASGATFEIEVGDPAGLVGPFKARIWPFDPENPPAWQDFEDITDNPAFGEDVDSGAYERDFRFEGLLFGVNYAVSILDENTGCIRWRNLGTVPEPTDNANFDVTAVSQAFSCRESNDGQVSFTVEGAGDLDLDGLQTVSWRIYNAHRPNDTSFHHSGTANDGGSGGTFTLPLITSLLNAQYVVEITAESGCVSGTRFAIHRPNTLSLKLNNVVNPNCNVGGQISVTSTGGWNNEFWFERLNQINSNWTPIKYAFVVNGTDPNALPDTDWTEDTFSVVNPTAYDGIQNVYQVYAKDAGGCIASLSSPITLNRDLEPSIDSIEVTNRCNSTNEIYDVVATITDGFGINNFIWDGELTTSKTRQLGPGNHTLEVRDANGCSVIENIFIYPQMVTKANISNVELCDPVNSGEVTIEVYGGSGDYSFKQITPAGSTNNTGRFSGLTHSTFYEFEVIDNLSGCATQIVSATFDMPVNPEFEARVLEQVSCFGASNGKIIVEPVAGSSNIDVVYEYSLNGGAFQTSNLFEGLPADVNFSVRVRSSKGCIETLPDIVINQPLQLELTNSSVTPFTCTADNTLGLATISVTVDNISGTPTGTAPYLFSYEGSSFTSDTNYQVPFKLVSQDIFVEVIDGNNCSDLITITVPAASKVSTTLVESQKMNCDDDAIISIEGDNGSDPSNYEIREFSSGNLINGLGNGTITIPAGNPGTYVYELIDTATGCSSIETYHIPQFDLIKISSITKIKDITCYGASDGAFTFEVSDFATSFSYELIQEGTATPLMTVQNNTSTAPILIDNLAPGIYYIMVTDVDSKCQKISDRITIQSPTSTLDFSHDIINSLSCDPGMDADVIAIPEGGWGSFEFQLRDLTNNQTLQNYQPNNVFSGLTFGIDYEIQLRDGNGCNSVVKTFSIPEITQLVITDSTIINPTCQNGNNGSIEITAEGGQGASKYQYILNNLSTGISGMPSNSARFEGLKEGTYTITVFDTKGCSVTSTPMQITYPLPVVINSAISREPTCTVKGEISLGALGGQSGGYEYRIIAPTNSITGWSTQNSYELDAGTYEFVARDMNSCESETSVVITLNQIEPLAVSLNSDNTVINCHGETDAVLIAEASGGKGDYFYQLEQNGVLIGNVQETPIFSGLGSGSFRILVTSAPDCEEFSDTVVINEPVPLIASVAQKQDVLCFGENSGFVTIKVQGGFPPYKYILSSNPSKAVEFNNFSSLEAGSYSVIVQDGNGCEIVVPFEINGPSAELGVRVKNVEDEVCFEEGYGAISLEVTGGTPPYFFSQYSQSGPYEAITDQENFVLTDLSASSHVIFIKDSNGCKTNLIQEIQPGVDLTAEYMITSECSDNKFSNKITVLLQDDSLASDVIYNLDSESVETAQESPIFENVEPGEHFISIIHQEGCQKSILNIIIDEKKPLTMVVKESGLNQIVVEAQGGDENYTYFFQGISNDLPSYTITETGTYTVRVIDGLGCEVEQDIFIEFYDIEIPRVFTPDGDNHNDVWKIINSSAYPNMQVILYDRQGRKLTEFIGSGHWNGTYQNKDLPAGDYWYIIRLNGEKDPREFIGPVTIYR